MNRINEKQQHLLCRLAFRLDGEYCSEDTWKFQDQIHMKLFIDIIEEIGLFPCDDYFLMTVLVKDERKIEAKIKIRARALGTETESDRRQAMNRRG